MAQRVHGAHNMTRLLSFFAIAGLALLDGRGQDRASQMDGYIQGLADSGLFQGSVLVAQNGATLIDKGYGLASAEFNVANTSSTKFRLGSLTKQFTAMAILQLQDRGLLNVTDPVCQYLPVCPNAWSAITIHQLLTHTSGIPDYVGFSDAQARSFSPVSPDDLIAYFSVKPLDFIPGTQFEYSNSGYVVLGRVVELLSGMSWDSFIQANIFTPLQMNATGYDSFTKVLQGRAGGYLLKNGKIDSVAPYLDMSWAYSAGGLYSSVDDMYLWTQALDNGTLVSPQLLNLMFTPAPNANGYGYGWVITHFFGQRVAAHDGEVNGFLSFIARFVDANAVLIILSNQESVDLGDMIGTLSALLLSGSKNYQSLALPVIPRPDSKLVTQAAR